MVEMTIVYEGGLHTRAVHGPSGAALETDAPLDNQGKGEAFSPTDLLATALGTCMLTTMGIVARLWAETGGLDDIAAEDLLVELSAPDGESELNAGLERFLETAFDNGTVRDAVIVTIVCDRGDRYLSTGVFPA